MSFSRDNIIKFHVHLNPIRAKFRPQKALKRETICSPKNLPNSPNPQHVPPKALFPTQPSLLHKSQPVPDPLSVSKPKTIFKNPAKTHKKRVIFNKYKSPAKDSQSQSEDSEEYLRGGKQMRESRNKQRSEQVLVDQNCQTADNPTLECDSIDNTYQIQQIERKDIKTYFQKPTSLSRRCSRPGNSFIIKKASDTGGDLSRRRNCMPPKKVNWFMTNQIRSNKLAKIPKNRSKRNYKKLSISSQNCLFSQTGRFAPKTKQRQRLIVKGLKCRDPKILNQKCNFSMVKIFNLLKNKLKNRMKRKNRNSRERSAHKTPQRSYTNIHSPQRRYLHLSPFGRGTLTGVGSLETSIHR
ncbi:unnamed protein product [Moneuplotes crassus]|uniref:Uncharacterized protein n=1 Tax=Euplotes crassus TaxID=5936 RepID=A0AAD1UD83_EUPCR|nr:unnamed protein product [Moneuplotes crassus]